MTFASIIIKKADLIVYVLALDFLDRCEYMVVLLSWQYFRRLWCVFEWAVFLMSHDPSKVIICCDSFLRSCTERSFVESVRKFSVKDAKCHQESDRKFVEGKIRQLYKSEELFEEYAKCTAIGLIGVTLMRMSPWSVVELSPWIDLAKELGHDEIAEALSKADPQRWCEEADRNSSTSGKSGQMLGAAGRGWHGGINKLIDDWVGREISPALESLKQRCLRTK